MKNDNPNLIRFEGVGFNKRALKGKSLQELAKEVEPHKFDENQVKELHKLVNSGDDKKPTGQVAQPQSSGTNP